MSSILTNIIDSIIRETKCSKKSIAFIFSSKTGHDLLKEKVHVIQREYVVKPADPNKEGEGLA